jgi:hypothetical protein
LQLPITCHERAVLLLLLLLLLWRQQLTRKLLQAELLLQC